MNEKNDRRNMRILWSLYHHYLFDFLNKMYTEDFTFWRELV